MIPLISAHLPCLPAGRLQPILICNHGFASCNISWHSKAKSCRVIA